MNDMTQQPAKDPPKNFPAMLTAWLPEIKRALPKHMSGDRMARIALTAFRNNPRLGECEPRSVFAAVLQSSQLGLEIGTLGRAHLVPYKVNKKIDGQWQSHYECQFIPGWKGLVDLMNNSGKGTVWTGAVFDGDEFDWLLGDSPFVKHKPGGENDPKKLLFVYAIGRVKGSDWPIIEVWSAEKVWKHRDRYNKSGEKHYSFENPEMYARKVPLLQVLKYMPCSPELAQAIALSDAAEMGAQNLNVKDVIDGTYMPQREEPEAPEEPGDSGKDALPAYPEDGFNKNLPGWLAQVTKKKKTPSEIIAMLATKYTLTEDQKRAISGDEKKPVLDAEAKPVLDPDAPAAKEDLAQLMADAEAAAISDIDIATHLGLKSLKNITLTVGQVEKVRAFLDDPMGASKK